MDFTEQIASTLLALTNAQGMLGEESIDVGTVGGSIMSASELLNEVESVITGLQNELESVHERNRSLQSLNNQLSQKIFIKKDEAEAIQTQLSLAQQIAESMKY